jgi:hypothetical protein
MTARARVSGPEFARQWPVSRPGFAWIRHQITWRPGWEPGWLPDELAGRSGHGTPGHFLTLAGSLASLTR